MTHDPQDITLIYMLYRWQSAPKLPEITPSVENMVCSKHVERVNPRGKIQASPDLDLSRSCPRHRLIYLATMPWDMRLLYPSAVVASNARLRAARRVAGHARAG